jgi:hypothetical protein
MAKLGSVLLNGVIAGAVPTVMFLIVSFENLEYLSISFLVVVLPALLFPILFALKYRISYFAITEDNHLTFLPLFILAFRRISIDIHNIVRIEQAFSRLTVYVKSEKGKEYPVDLILRRWRGLDDGFDAKVVKQVIRDVQKINPKIQHELVENWKITR